VPLIPARRDTSAVAIGEFRFMGVFVAVREFINIYSTVSCYSDCGESPKSFDFVEVKHSQRRSKKKLWQNNLMILSF
jgi:hypothetical protein